MDGVGVFCFCPFVRLNHSLSNKLKNPIDPSGIDNQAGSYNIASPATAIMLRDTSVEVIVLSMDRDDVCGVPCVGVSGGSPRGQKYVQPPRGTPLHIWQLRMQEAAAHCMKPMLSESTNSLSYFTWSIRFQPFLKTNICLIY